MLSAAGLLGGVSSTKKPVALLAPPPIGSGKIRSPLPPPPNDPAVSRMQSGSSGIKSKEPKRTSVDPLSNLSQLEVLDFFYISVNFFGHDLIVFQ